jgi:HD-GYP domain-containing protein (c-di-GMP phosphodiesterase class II)
MNLKSIKLPLAVFISLSFAFILVLTGSLIGFFTFSGTKEILTTTTSKLIERTGEGTISDLQRIYEPVQGFVSLLVAHPLVDAKTTEERMTYLPFLKTGLDAEKEMSAAYVGYEDGSFFLLRTIEQTYKMNYTIPEGARYLLQSLETNPGGDKILFIFYDQNLERLVSFSPPDYSFDPRTREWYKEATQKEIVIRSDPYIFFTTGEVGKTFAIATSSRNAVVGADVTLGAISRSLAPRKITQSTEIALIDPKKNAVAYLNPSKLLINTKGDKVQLAHLDELDVPILKTISDVLKTDSNQSNYVLEEGDITWIVNIQKIQIQEEEINYLIFASPEEELFLDAKKSLNKILLITLGLILVALPVIWIVSQAISRSLVKLNKYTDSIRNFQFSGSPPRRSSIREMDELGKTVGIMKDTIQNFLDISSMLTAQKDFGKLMQNILSETVAITDAKAGILYLVSNLETSLELKSVFLNDGTEIPITDAPEISLEKESDTFPILSPIREGKTTVLLVESVMYFNELKFFGTENNFGFKYIIVVPMKNQDNEFIGVMCLFMDKDVSRKAGLLSFIEKLSGTSAIAIENHRLLEAQKELFESFIKLIADAIDTKSPYTGGHCSRVPELAKLLADAAVDQKEGVFADFSLNSKEREALHIGAWLHDCGKIVTPEYVVDKSTKLETIYDRLHEIRMRFEVIKRDKQIQYYKDIIAGGNKESLTERLELDLKTLDEDFQFIASCNEGGEYMAPEKVERLKAIANRTWVRTLDDTIGLSHEEKTRKGNGKSTLPVVEHLLADKPEHIIERKDSDTIKENNPWGFRVNTPQYKFNYGEVYNLSIGRGTLTEEERYIINAHMIQTIKMLDELPFPKHLRTVPEIAGGHHEKMDGTGYPKRLHKQDMSVLARIMSIADVFEALTAVDRPYKKGKTLSEAIKIMHHMKKDQHLDGDLFDLFLTSGIYMEYANRYMRPYQIDTVDISLYVNP